MALKLQAVVKEENILAILTVFTSNSPDLDVPEEVRLDRN